jgi:hypothetical protein
MYGGDINMLYKKEITIIQSQPIKINQDGSYIEWTNDVKLEVSYDSSKTEYVAILKIGKNDVYKEYQIFYFKAPYEHKYGFVNLREIFKNSHLDYDYNMYIPNELNNTDLMTTIIHLFETIQNEIMLNENKQISKSENNKNDVMI